MAVFDLAIIGVLRNEGTTYTEADGNPTKYGLTLRFLVNSGIDMSQEQLAALPESLALNYYKTLIWDKYAFARINNQLIANYLFDMFVNHGAGEATKLAQRALWAAYQSLRTKADGILGDITLGEINNAPQCYLAILRGLRIAYYLETDYYHEPDELRGKFLNDWLHRAIGI